MVPTATDDEISIVKLAREIAMDLRELDQILEMHGVTKEKFEKLKVNPRFVAVLSSELASWGTALNTNERVKLKAGSMIEEFLPELYARLVDPRENLMAKVKGAELVTKLAGMGVTEAKVHDPSDRVTITINLGEDKKLEFRKPLPAQVIEHEATFEESIEESMREEALDVSNSV
jgi:hypothetical protein